MSDWFRAWCEGKTRTIQVVGDSQLETVPDLLTFSVRVEAANERQGAAIAQMEVSVAKVMSILNNYRVPANDVKTSVYMSSRTVQSSGSSIWRSQPPTQIHLVVKSIIITLTGDLVLPQRYQAFMTELMDAGALSNSDERYDVSRSAQLRSQAREMACINALARAQALALTLGCVVGAPIRVQELTNGISVPTVQRSNYDYGGSSFFSSASTSSSKSMSVPEKEGPPFFELGIITFKCTVDSTFEIMTDPNVSFPLPLRIALSSSGLPSTALSGAAPNRAAVPAVAAVPFSSCASGSASGSAIS